MKKNLLMLVVATCLITSAYMLSQEERGREAQPGREGEHGEPGSPVTPPIVRPPAGGERQPISEPTREGEGEGTQTTRGGTSVPIVTPPESGITVKTASEAQVIVEEAKADPSAAASRLRKMAPREKGAIVKDLIPQMTSRDANRAIEAYDEFNTLVQTTSLAIKEAVSEKASEDVSRVVSFAVSLISILNPVVLARMAADIIASIADSIAEIVSSLAQEPELKPELDTVNDQLEKSSGKQATEITLVTDALNKLDLSGVNLEDVTKSQLDTYYKYKTLFGEDLINSLLKREATIPPDALEAAITKFNNDYVEPYRQAYNVIARVKRWPLNK